MWCWGSLRHRQVLGVPRVGTHQGIAMQPTRTSFALNLVTVCWCPVYQPTNQPQTPGVLVLEELEHAKARGARIYAEYVGGAFTCDAHHMTEPQPQGRGVSSCLHKALESAGWLV